MSTHARPARRRWISEPITSAAITVHATAMRRPLGLAMPPVGGTGPQESGPPTMPAGKVEPSSLVTRSNASPGSGIVAPSPGAVSRRER